MTLRRGHAAAPALGDEVDNVRLSAVLVYPAGLVAIVLVAVMFF